MRTSASVITMASSAVIVRVIVSPTFALVVSSTLSEMIEIAVSAGGVLSITTPDPSVTPVTLTPALLARSSNEMLIDTAPSATADPTTTYDALQLLPDPLTIAGRPASTTVGVVMSSLDVNDSVMVSPWLTLVASFELSEVMLTAGRVGTVRSISTVLASVVVL